MLASSSIDLRAAEKVFEAVERGGVAPRALCSAAGLDHALLDAPEARMPFDALVLLYEQAAKMMRDPAFGLHLGQQTDPERYELLGYLAINCQTFGDALGNLTRYARIWTDAVSFSIENRNGEARLSYHYRNSALSAEQRRQEAEHMLSTMTRAARLLTGVDCAPVAVWFEHRKPRDISSHKKVFRAPVRFGAERTELVFHRSSLELPVRRADSQLRALLERHAIDLLRTLPPGDSLADQVRRAIAEAARLEELRLNAVARKLKMGGRTLQRNLQRERRSFQEIMRETRSALAKQHLRNPRLAICEVAYLLGFSQPSAFHRAFHGWTGMTPKKFRASLNATTRQARNSNQS